MKTVSVSTAAFVVLYFATSAAFAAAATGPVPPAAEDMAKIIGDTPQPPANLPAVAPAPKGVEVPKAPAQKDTEE
jgi:hypothetical protein